VKIEIKKYQRVGIAVFSTLLFIGYFFHVFSENYKPSIGSFRTNFTQLETKLNHVLNENKKRIQKVKGEELWLKPSHWEDINIHIYRSDSLIYWNTNQLPIIRFADIHFPTNGILHLQNGWYYAKTIEVNHHLICASFLIKNDYSYENIDLVNEFPTSLFLSFDTYITFEQEHGYRIYSIDKKYLFSIHPNKYQSATNSESILLMVLLLSCITFWFFTLGQLNKSIAFKWDWTIPLGLIILRILSLKLVWFGFMHDTESFQASLYGTDEWFPNFSEYLINCLVIAYVILYLSDKLKEINLYKFSKFGAVLFLLFTYFFWIFLVYLNKSIIENSSIPLVLEKLFSLNVYSVFALASIGLLFYVFYQLVREIIRFSFRINFSFTQIIILNSILGISFFIYQVIYGHQIIYASIFPFIVTFVIILTIYKEKKSGRLGFGVLYLFLFSSLIALNLGEFNNRKERSERELYSNQLATEKDIVTEVEYSNIVNRLNADEVLMKIINSPHYVDLSDFEDGLERRIFNGFWERYEISFNLFNKNHESIINYSANKTGAYDVLDKIIKRHGIPSEIDSSIFFINNYAGHFSYIIRQTFYDKDSNEVYLTCTLKSKKIPEEIGFPRLLISTKTKVFEPLQNYSIAKYYKNRLVTKYGKFNYPSSDLALNHWKDIKTGYYDSDGFNHYILKKTYKDVIVLSTKNYTVIELITSFSYLFSFYGLLLLPSLFRFNLKSLFPIGFTLALKIQLVLISLVFLSLLAFGWGSGIFVSDQYHEFTNDLIREKLNSVKMELQENIGKEDNLSIQQEGNNVELLLQKFAKTFVTDVNLYDQKGFLIAASRPKVFNIGLLSEQMNPTAFLQMDVKDKSEFIHQENIGKLSYSSAYSPFYSNDGKLQGYLNLQHFSQQKEFENQIQKFLVAIINVFMLLLAISIVISIFVSNWVTLPLRIIQESFSKIKFGKHNQQILYDKQDEIGALVKDYNQKLEELEFTAQQLAQSEREMAWREMAKQVAHEIKNPLTPMKLSVQQLQRVFDPTDPNSAIKIQKVTNSIIEQIDALAKIANEFSSFAKMPRPNESKLDLLPLIENVIEVFKQEEKCILLTDFSINECIVIADKDMIIRVFNNLIKNAIQSTNSIEGEIKISISQENENYLFEIKDNGIGISAEKHSKIFVPYFTTKSTGTGLGLAMVKQIIETHRGNIWFNSVENEGTSFYFTLPKYSYRSEIN